MLKNSSRSKTLQREGETRGHLGDPWTTKTTMGPRFFNMFKNSRQSLFWYPTLGGLRRSCQIFPRRYRVVLDSARRFQTIFRKNVTNQPKKGSVLSGPKQSLVKWPLKRASEYAGKHQSIFGPIQYNRNS